MQIQKEQLANLNAGQKRALLLELMKNTTEWPLSHGQEALWLIQHHAPDTCAYNVAACLEIDSALDAGRMRQAMEYLVQRHPLLRSRYVSRDGRLKQIIGESVQLAWSEHSVAQLDDDGIAQVLDQAYRVPFDLQKGPVCRAHLFQRSASRWYFLLCVHHIAIDGWSLWRLLDELQESYRALSVQQRPALPALSASYLDFVVRQRSVAGSQAGKAQLRYWMEELQGDLPVLQLPTDNVRPPQQTFNGAGHTVEFSAGFSAQYLAFCRQQGVTPFVLGLALYSVLLHRFSNQNEFLVATPCAGRDGSEFMDLVGYFVNPLPLRVQLEDDPAFSDFLQHIDRKIRQALQHQDIPFATLVEKRQLKRDPSYPVLCQAMFVHQKQPAGANRIGFGSGHYDWGLLRARHYPLHQQEGQFDVSLEVLEGDNSLAAHWKYNADLFAPDTIASMAAIFEQLALDVFADAERKLSALRLIHAADCDRYRLPPQATFPVQHSLQETFSRIARQHGEQVAIVHEGVQLSYRQLEDRSNALAQAILQQGTQPGEAVGILLERSIDLVASLLAVLKAGCCYVPLDPTYPSDRLHYMTADAGARVVVTSRNNVAEADALKLQPLYVEDVPAIPAPGLQLPPTEKHQLAYILYTSGSTGRPKGVKVSHGNVLRLFDATQGIYGFDHTDVWTLFHSYAFDFSVWEIWGALLFGGKLVVVPYETSRSPEDFHRLLVREGVTVLNQTPSAFQQLMRADLQQPAPSLRHSLRWVIFGGEALDVQSLQPWFKKYGDQQPTLVNMYGITETTVHVTHRVLRHQDALSPQSVIGQPLPDLHILILDRHRQVVPRGVPGELYVGGAGVSQGYHGRDELTAERFIDNPLLPGQKLYRTGDLGRWVSARDIAYMGRIDHQIQLRGFRVELGEIENQISSHSGVATVTVMVREDVAGDVRLVAYYIPAGNDGLQWPELRQYLRSRLPDYMIPVAGVALAQFPLTPNGKIDQKALPKPDYTGQSSLAEPRDAMEQRLTQLWAEVLGLPRVGIQDNFFEIGGYSLLAARLIERMQRSLDVKVPLALLFRNPTVAQLARELRQTCRPQWSPLVPLQTRGEGTPIFCVPGGSGNALYYQPLAQALGGNRPVYGLQAKGLDGDVPPLTSVEAMAAENVQALLGIQPEGPYIIAGHCFGGLIAFEMANQLCAQGAEVERLILMDVPAPFPAHRPPSLGWGESEWLAQFIAVLEQSTGIRPGFDQQALIQLPFEQQLQHCQHYMEQAGLLPGESDIRQVMGLLNVFKTNSQTPYSPPARNRLPITLIRAADFHPAFDYSAADDAHDIALSSLGWRRVADATLEIRCVPGNHISMLMPPCVQDLADNISASLDASQVVVNSRPPHPLNDVAVVV